MPHADSLLTSSPGPLGTDGGGSALPASVAEMSDVSFYSERKGFLFGETGQVVSHPSYSSPAFPSELDSKQARHLGSVVPVFAEAWGKG